MHTSRVRVAAALGVAITSISFAAIFFKLAQPTHPLISSMVRLALASVMLAPFVVRGWWRGSFRAHHVGAAAWCGACYAVHFGAWVWSLQLTSVAASATLVTVSPLFLALIGQVTRKDRVGARQGAALMVACAGIGLIGWSDLGGGALVGDALAVLGALAMAFYLLRVRGLARDLDVLGFSGMTCAFGALFLFGAARFAHIPVAVDSATSLLYLFLAACIPQLIGHTLMTWSLRHVSPATVGIATLGEPVGASLLGVLWLREWMSWPVALGCVIVLGAVGVALTARGGEADAGT